MGLLVVLCCQRFDVPMLIQMQSVISVVDNLPNTNVHDELCCLSGMLSNGLPQAKIWWMKYVAT